MENKMDMEITWFMKKAIAMVITSGRLMVGYFIFTVISEEVKIKALQYKTL